MERQAVLFVLVLRVMNLVHCHQPRIAILGAGIGGTSCAYFLKEYLADAVDIHVYEGNKIGGRLATVDYEGSEFESGGCVIHERNKYMNDFRDKFQLKKRPDSSDRSFGIYDDNQFQFLSSRYRVLTWLKMIWRYGYSLHRLHSFVDNMLDHFDRIYELQENGKSFRTVEELFGEASSLFMPFFNMSSKEGFSKQANVNENTINDLVQGSLRVNYGQSTNVHLFVGAVSVAGMADKLWSVYGGNRQVPELLLKHSSASFFAQLVNEVTYDKKNKKYIVESSDPVSKESFSRSYDVVIVANPITGDSVTPIKFSNFSKPVEVKGRYHRTVATIVSGVLNGSYYGLPPNEAPELVINNNVKDALNSVGKIDSVDGEGNSTVNVWKIFSQRPLSDYELDKLFQKRSVAKVVDWLAYPDYEKLALSSTFVLHDRLFYVNAIEWAASAMEMSVIGAKNVALLVQKEISKEEVKSKKVQVNYRKVEL